jgi:hypothetical protein
MRSGNDNEQIELDNFKADYFDANVTGKSAFIFCYFLSSVNSGAKTAFVVGLQGVILRGYTSASSLHDCTH